jgi:PEGA domain-containing protein
MRVVRYAVLATVTAHSAPGATAVTVTSMAPGSPIYVNGHRVGATPARIPISTRRDSEITVCGAEGQHTCRQGRFDAQPWLILGVYATPSWLVDRMRTEDDEWLDITQPGI